MTVVLIAVGLVGVSFQVVSIIKQHEAVTHQGQHEGRSSVSVEAGVFLSSHIVSPQSPLLTHLGAGPDFGLVSGG